MTLPLIKPHSGILTRGEKVGCRKKPEPSASSAGCLMSWHTQLKQKLGVVQEAVLLYLKCSKMC